MARSSKSSLEKENRVKKVRESGRASKRGNSSKEESDRNKRTRSSSNRQKNSEVTRKTKESKTNKSKKERKEQSSGSDSKSRSSTTSADSFRHSSGRRASSPEPIVQRENVLKEVGSLKELLPATITRETMGKLLYAPFFNSTVIGCYVRLSQGATGCNQLSYIIWKIVGVEELDVVYEFDNKPTNKCIRCQRGSEERLFRIKFVSNSDIQPIEFMDWLACNKSSGIPTINTIDMKKAVLHRVLTHRYQHDEIEEMIKAKKQFQNGSSKFALNKVELLKQKALAVQSGDVQDASLIQQEIDKLDRAPEELDKKRSKVASILALINKRNRAEMKNHIVSESVNEHSKFDSISRKRGHVAEIAQPSASEPQLPTENIIEPESVSMASFSNVDDLDIDHIELTEIDASLGMDVDIDTFIDMYLNTDMEVNMNDASSGTSEDSQSPDSEVSGSYTSPCI